MTYRWRVVLGLLVLLLLSALSYWWAVRWRHPRSHIYRAQGEVNRNLHNIATAARVWYGDEHNDAEGNPCYDYVLEHLQTPAFAKPNTVNLLPLLETLRAGTDNAEAHHTLLQLLLSLVESGRRHTGHV